MFPKIPDHLINIFEALDAASATTEIKKVARAKNAEDALVDCIHYLMRIKTSGKACDNQVERFKLSCLKACTSALKKMGSAQKVQENALNNHIHYVVDHGHIKLLRWCLKNGASALGSVGTACLEKALSNCDANMVKLLISQGADVNSGKIPCWLWAAPPGRSDMLPLVMKAGAQINARSYDGDYTALHIWVACAPLGKDGDMEDPTLDCLISHGIDLEAKNQYQKTAQEMTVEMRRPDLCEKINAAIARNEKSSISKVTAKVAPKRTKLQRL